MKVVLITLVLAAFAAVARAQPRAEDLFTQGQRAYDKADYATAIAKWQASYDLSKESALLFNVAQAQRLAGDCTNAIATYRRFTAVDPDLTSDQHKIADDFVKELAPTCKQPVEPRQQSRIQPLPQPAHPGHGLRIAGIAGGAVGLATVTTGLLLGYHGQTLGNEVTHACASSCDWAAQKGKDADGRRDVSIGRVLDIAGAVTIAGGAVMYYLGVRGDSLTVAPMTGERGAVLSWSGSW